MRITKKLKAARAAFKQRVASFLQELGAVEHDGLYEFKLLTPIGEMGISLWDSAIMCRFWDVEQAKEFTRRFTSQACNPYSGKWNWHFDDDANTLNGDCEASFRFYMERVMGHGLPDDLTTLTPGQHDYCVCRLEVLPLADLRRRQDLTAQQIEAAHEQRNDKALANLRVREEHLRLAVNRKDFDLV